MKAENLRKSILQMAIQGKLVPQNPDDEPASVLLERIRAEKQRLIKEGKIKKDKSDSVIFRDDDNRHYEKIGSEVKDITDEIDFDLPANWSICHFSDIADIFTGNSINEQEKQKKYFGQPVGYNYIGTKDVSFDHTINYCNGVRIPYNTQFKIAHKGMPLLCIEGGSAGRKIGILSEDVCFGNKLCVFETFGINAKFVYYFLQAPFFVDVFKASTTGIIGGVSLNVIKSLYFLLPPLAEQERIVAEIEKYEPLIAEYDKLEQEKSKLDGEIYDKLKKSILQYAIQGKLVQQEPSDEPASILLEKIRAEKKAKLGKKYVDSFIYKGDDNCYYEHIDGAAEDKPLTVPFDLPNGWAWCKIKEFGDVLGGKRIPAGRKLSDDNNGHIYIKVSDMKNGSVNTDKLQYVPDDIFMSISRYIIKKEDIYITVAGTIGQVGIIPAELDGANLTENADRIVFRRLNQKWLLKCLESNVVQTQIIAATTKVGQPKLAIARIQEFLIPSRRLRSNSGSSLASKNSLPVANNLKKMSYYEEQYERF